MSFCFSSPSDQIHGHLGLVVCTPPGRPGDSRLLPTGWRGRLGWAPSEAGPAVSPSLSAAGVSGSAHWACVPEGSAQFCALLSCLTSSTFLRSLFLVRGFSVLPSVWSTEVGSSTPSSPLGRAALPPTASVTGWGVHQARWREDPVETEGGWGFTALTWGVLTGALCDGGNSSLGKLSGGWVLCSLSALQCS